LLERIQTTSHERGFSQEDQKGQKASTEHFVASRCRPLTVLVAR